MVNPSQGVEGAPGTGWQASGELARQSLDLRGMACPVNFIRTRLALESIEPGDWLQVDLDGGEPSPVRAFASASLRQMLQCEPPPNAPLRAFARSVWPLAN